MVQAKYWRFLETVGTLTLSRVCPASAVSLFLQFCFRSAERWKRKRRRRRGNDLQFQTDTQPFRQSVYIMDFHFPPHRPSLPHLSFPPGVLLTSDTDRNVFTIENWQQVGGEHTGRERQHMQRATVEPLAVHRSYDEWNTEWNVYFRDAVRWVCGFRGCSVE